MSGVVNVSRRGFLEHLFSAGALVVGAPLALREAAMAAAGAWQAGMFVAIEPDGAVKIVAHRSEMGTGAKTCLPMIVADELEADWARVTIVQAVGDERYGSQNTDGSCSVRDFYDAMRLAGASARTMLEQAAANKWGVPAAECKGQNHFVVHAATGRKLGYGELSTAAAALPAPDKAAVRFKTPQEFRYIGKELPIADRHDLVTGKGVFGYDAKMPGMVYATVERPPVMGAAMKGVDDAAAKRVKGVRQVVTLDLAKPPYAFNALGGVAVIADNTWSALQGRKALKVDWDLGEHASYDSEAYRKEMLATAQKPCKVVRESGNVDAEFAKGGKIVEASYTTPMLSHAPMEPPAAVAEWKDGKVVTWANTQNPQAVQETVAGALGIKKEDVTCHVTLLGGGFGRKSKPDYVAEAALLSKQTGKPVKIVWSREDDIRFDFYHAPAAMHLKAAVDERGRPTAWLQRSVAPPIFALWQKDLEHQTLEVGPGFGWGDIPYPVANLRVECGPAKPHIRIGWLRSVANVYHAFGVQSFTDELAAAAGRDRVEYLLETLGAPRVVELKGSDARFPFDTGRLRHVIELAAEKSGWAKKKPGPGRALGIAAHWSFFAYVAAVVEVEVSKAGEVKIPRVDIAVDAGRVINPERVRSQFEGASVFGTSIAMLSGLSVAGGRVKESNYNGYQVSRMSHAPRMTHVHIVPSDAAPAGVGEPGVPPMAPAICNAIFAATGKRVRDLPVKGQLAG
jgi:isoquinoline 1-oxidoreductase beta subunit